jgi:hypothetical protein
MTQRMTLLLLIVLFLASAVSAQGDSTLFKLLTKDRVTDCPTYILNAKRLIPVYYESGKLDSINVVFGFLDSACGSCVNEFDPLKRLLEIDAGTFNDPLCNQSFINEILGQRYYYGYDLDYMFSGVYRSAVCDPGAGAYDGFVQSLARGMAEATDTLSIAHVYCLYLLGEDQDILERLKRGEYAGTCLGRAYQSRLDSLANQLKTGHLIHWAVGMGVWSPQSAADRLGNKIEMVARWGFHKHRFLADLVGSIRFLKPAEPYEVGVDGKAKITNSFLGGYFGVETGYECIRWKRFAIDLHGGIGYDGIDCFDSDHYSHYKESVNSGNLNLGVTPRVFINKTRTKYLGLQCKYNWVKYRTGGGSDLSGNTISVNLLYGSLSNRDVVDQLKRLLYYE